jgi:hypothetical protein
LPSSIIAHNLTRRIKVSVKEFKEDCDMLLKVYNILISIFLSFVVSKKMIDDIDREAHDGNPEVLKIREETRFKLDQLLKEMTSKIN